MRLIEMQLLFPPRYFFLATALVLPFVQGCTSAPIYGGKKGAILVAPVDEITSREEAVDCLMSLRDHQSFPALDAEDVEVSEFSMTIRGPQNTTGMVTLRSKARLQDEFGDSVVYSRTRGESREVSHRDSIVFRFKDIGHISVYSSTLFATDPRNDQAYITSSGYECVVYAEGKSPCVFTASSETAAKRLAMGLSFLSKIEVESNPDFPPSGAKLDSENHVQWLLAGGPFDLAGIPVLSKILSVDGLEDGEQYLDSLVQHMGIGTHQVVIRKPGYSKNREIAVEIPGPL